MAEQATGGDRPKQAVAPALPNFLSTIVVGTLLTVYDLALIAVWALALASPFHRWRYRALLELLRREKRLNASVFLLLSIALLFVAVLAHADVTAESDKIRGRLSLLVAHGLIKGGDSDGWTLALRLIIMAILCFIVIDAGIRTAAWIDSSSRRRRALTTTALSLGYGVFTLFCALYLAVLTVLRIPSLDIRLISPIVSLLAFLPLISIQLTRRYRLGGERVLVIYPRLRFGRLWGRMRDGLAFAAGVVVPGIFAAVFFPHIFIAPAVVESVYGGPWARGIYVRAVRCDLASDGSVRLLAYVNTRGVRLPLVLGAEDFTLALRNSAPALNVAQLKFEAAPEIEVKPGERTLARFKATIAPADAAAVASAAARYSDNPRDCDLQPKMADEIIRRQRAG